MVRIANSKPKVEVNIIIVLLVPVYHVMMVFMVIQPIAELQNLIAPSVQIHRIKRQLVVRAIFIPVQQYYSRASPRLGRIDRVPDARFHVFMVVPMVHIATTTGSLFGTANVPMRGN